MNARWLVLACCLGTVTAQAADWPQWRGPHRDGISAEAGLLDKWPEEGPPLVWHAQEIGDGYSTPAVTGDRLFVISNQGVDDEYVQCLSTVDAKQHWRTRLGKVGPNEGPQYPGSRSTPTVDGKLLFALGSDGDLACLESDSGKVRWTRNLRSDFGGKPGKWAYSESPLVDGEKLIVTPGGKDATMVALHKQTGETLWKCATPEADEASYASVIVVHSGGVKQYVQFLAQGLVGVAAEDGKLLWRYDRTAQGSPANIPTPVASDQLIYSAASRSGGGLVKLAVAGDTIKAEQVYFEPKMPSSIGGSVLVDGYLYGTNSQGLMCVKFDTGEVKWQNRSVGAASVLAANGRLYVNGDTGDVALVEITPDEYREHGRFKLPDQPDRGRSKAWAYPVIADGKLYLRDLGSLWCYDIAK